jgi:hypothetical protein
LAKVDAAFELVEPVEEVSSVCDMRTHVPFFLGSSNLSITTLTYRFVTFSQNQRAGSTLRPPPQDREDGTKFLLLSASHVGKRDDRPAINILATTTSRRKTAKLK